MNFKQYHAAVVKEMHALSDLGVASPAAKLSSFTNSLIEADIRQSHRDFVSVSMCCDLLIDMGA